MNKFFGPIEVKMRRSARLALASAIVVFGVTFAGHAGAQEDPPAIPIEDLPPFPEVASPESDDSPTGPIIDILGEDVVVGASKREQSLGSVASAVTLITADQIKRFGFRTISEAVSSVTGIFVVDDRMIERVGIRGVQLLGDANTRILVLIDGSPLNEPWSQYVDTSYALPIHLDDVARIEVIRGPVSSVYGTNAFLGIINIVTLGADQAPPVYGRIGADSFGSATGNAGFGYGSVDRQVRANVAWTRRGAEDLTYEPFLDDEQLNPFDTDQDQIDALNGAVQVHFDRLFFQVRGHTRTRGLPGAPYNSVTDSGRNENTDTQLLAELGYNREINDKINVAGRLYSDVYRFRGVLEFQDDDGASTRIFESEGDSLWYGGEVRGLFDLSSVMPTENGRLDLTAGVATEFSQTDSRSFTRGAEDMTIDIDKPFNIQGVYSELNIEPFDWIGITAGVRLDLNSEFENNVSPRTALFLKRGETVGLKILFAEGFRNPSIFEAFYADGERFQPACGSVQECDAMGTTLFPEEITSYEAVLWGRPFPGVKVRASVWNWQVQNLIEKRNVFDPLIFEQRLQYQNLSELDSRGFELEGSYRNTAGWYGFANVSIADVVRNEEDAENAPEVVAKGGVSTPRIADLAHVSSDVSFVGERLTRDKDVTAGSHVQWNAAIYAPDFKGVDITIGVRNILGKRQDIPAQVDYDRVTPLPTGSALLDDVLLIPGPGREFFGRLGYRF